MPNLPAAVCFQPQHVGWRSPCVHQVLGQPGAVGPLRGDIVPLASPAGRGEGQSLAPGAAGAEVAALGFCPRCRSIQGHFRLRSLFLVGEKYLCKLCPKLCVSRQQSLSPGQRGCVSPVPRRGRGSTGTSAPPVHPKGMAGGGSPGPAALAARFGSPRLPAPWG